MIKKSFITAAILMSSNFSQFSAMSSLQFEHQNPTIATPPDTIKTSQFLVEENEIIDRHKHIIHNPQWYPFMGWKYDYKPLKYTEEELNLITDIITRESNSTETQGKLIDQYFVMVCFVRQYYKKGYKSITQQLTSSTQFSYPSQKNRGKESWIKNKQTVKNVLDCTIPEFVPYIPNGTVCYWNDIIDTSKDQYNRLQKYYVKVATTVKGTAFFAKVENMTYEEREYLKNYLWAYGSSKMQIFPKSSPQTPIAIIDDGAVNML